MPSDTMPSRVDTTIDAKGRSHRPKPAGVAAKKKERALTIGAVAREVKISPSMIRSWEQLGLISPARKGSNYRTYSRGDVEVLRRAVYMRRVRGLNAQAILDELRKDGCLRTKSPARVVDSSIGTRLRRLRIQSGKTLAEVAGAVDVSVGFLSNIERSHGEVSIGVMRRLAQYYGLNILDFFSPPQTPGPLVRATERKALPGGPGVSMELLASGKLIMEAHLFRVAPGAGSGEFYSHPGEEILYLMSGELKITLEGSEYHLYAGDSFYFESTIRHTWRNPGQTEAVIIWINTPPTF